MIRIAICDDDEKFLDKIENMLQNSIEIDAEILRFNSGIDLLKSNIKKIDILFIDIEMPEISGFDVMEKLGELNIIVIFVSNYAEKVYKSIKYSPFRFIRKDVIAEEIKEAIASAKERLIAKNKSIILNVKRNMVKVSIEDILYIESFVNKLVFITENKTYEIRGSLNSYKDDILFKNFCMPHRSYLVNLSKISSIEKSDLILVNGEKIPISKKRKKDIEAAFISY